MTQTQLWFGPGSWCDIRHSTDANASAGTIEDDVNIVDTGIG